jgi:hypothetical protein
MPNITSMEIAVVFAALVLLYIGPAALAWNVSRRRRPLEPAARAQTDWSPTTVGTYAEPLTAAEVGAPGIGQPVPEAAISAPPSSLLVEDGSVRPNVFAGTEPSPVPKQPTEGAASLPPLKLSGETAIELHPLEGSGRYRFTLENLRQADLPDWPPPVIRDAPQRFNLWREAEEVFAQYRSTIIGATVVSPYPARSVCLGSAGKEGEAFRLEFLLFPNLWPVGPEEAAARAVFTINSAGGEIQAWVDALQPSELTAACRREIADAGGEAYQPVE